MNRREAEELLPWFVAGTLAEEEARAVQAFIDNGEINAADLEELTLFAQTVSERQVSEPAYNRAILQKAMSQLDGITQEAPEVPLVVGEVGSDAGASGYAGTGGRNRDESPGLLQRLLDALQWSTTPPMARVVLAGQFALLFGLAVMVATRTEAPGEVGSVTVSGEQVALTPDFSLSFAPGTTEAGARALLLENKISIVSGPSALGIYQIAAPAGADLDAVAERLNASPLIVYLQAVPQP